MAGEYLGSELGDRRWRDSLQARLIASHVLVILLALGLVLLISAAFLRRYERTAAEERLAQLAIPLTAEVNVARLGTGANGARALRVDAIDAQAGALKIRILILEPDGTVRYDTSEQDNLLRQSLPQYSAIASAVLTRAQNDAKFHYEFVVPPRDDLFAGKRLLIASGQTGPFAARRAMMIVTDNRRFPLLGLFLSRLLLVTGISLMIASAFGLVFSRRIAHPVRRLTIAADAMARGQLEQEVTGGGPDEIGRLVGSFNAMSRQVATTYRSQRELLANVAHELRTPLTSVQGYAQAIRDGVIEDDDERYRALTVIGRESERMSNLIGQLLDLARLESGQAELTIRPVAVLVLLDRLRERFRPVATERHVVMTTASPEGLTVLGDEGRLLQLLSNLVANAIRHTPSGGLVAIDARSLEALNGGGPAVRIAVHDTGEGIAFERLPTIFDRFHRGERTASDSSSGFGLGLAIVRELVELHGGKIEVESELGRGTTFTVELPSARLVSVNTTSSFQTASSAAPIA
jgi:signal transduction histidine kinase